LPTTRSILIPNEADHGKKPWVAQIVGRDPKTIYKREFMSQHVTKPGVYEATERKNRRAFYGVFYTKSGDLCRIKIGDATLAELVDGWLDRMDEIVAHPDADPALKLRNEDGSFRVRSKLSVGEPVDDAALVKELREALSNTLSLLRAFTTEDDAIARVTRQQAEAALARSAAYRGAAQ